MFSELLLAESGGIVDWFLMLKDYVLEFLKIYLKT